jgi:spore coat protein CotH
LFATGTVHARHLGFLLVLAACGSGAPDPSAPVFDPTRVIEVEVEIAAADWDVLRAHSRTINDIFGACLMEPFADPFTYFPATVTIDGRRMEQVGIRKKGFLGSLDPDKPSLLIQFDEYVERPFFGLRSFTVNNSKQDPSFIRQCLTYQTFAAAGVPASRCNFAHVRVNGMDLGSFVHVEGGNKDFLGRHFDDPDGNLYEGTLSDFRAGWARIVLPDHASLLPDPARPSV